MTRGLLVVALVAGVILAGCSGGAVSEAESPDTQTDETPTDTFATPECSELEPRDRPELPSNLTRQTAVTFAETHANVTTWNEDIAGSERRRVSIVSTGYVLNETATGYIVHVRYNYGTLECDNAKGDSPVWTRDYFINESLVAMNQSNEGVVAPQEHDPVSLSNLLENGTVVER